MKIATVVDFGFFVDGRFLSESGKTSPEVKKGDLVVFFDAETGEEIDIPPDPKQRLAMAIVNEELGRIQ